MVGGGRPNKRQREDERLVFPTPGWFVTLEVRHISLGLPGALQECELLQQESASSTSTPLKKGQQQRRDAERTEDHQSLWTVLRFSHGLNQPELLCQRRRRRETSSRIRLVSCFFHCLQRKHQKPTTLPRLCHSAPSSLVPSRVRPTVPEPKHQKPTRNPTGDLCFTERRTEFVTPVTQLLPWLQLATVPWWQTCTVYTLSVLTHLYTIFFTRYYRWKYHVDLSNQTRSDPGHRFTFLEASGAFLFRTILSCGGISTHLGHTYLSLEGKRTGCNERIMLAMKYFKANVS